MSVLLLTEKDVADLLTMKDVVDACEKTFANWGEGKVVCPSKVTLELGEDAGKEIPSAFIRQRAPKGDHGFSVRRLTDFHG